MSGSNRSIFSKKNFDFSASAHDSAIDQVYPGFLPEGFVVEDLSCTDEDFNEGKDRRIAIPWGKDYPLTVTVQERFRRMQYAKYRQVTMTEYDYHANFRGELYKIEADFLVYGYFDEKTGLLGETIVVDVPRLKLGITTGAVKFQRGMHKAQMRSFVAFDFDALEEAGAVVYHYVPEAGNEA